MPLIRFADITQFETEDNLRNYIYLVVDNFSRKILSYKVADRIKAEYRRETILEAYENTRLLNPSVMLITDGGPENKTKFTVEIDHRIALVDINYSNSLIEAHNKVLKYNYLYKTSIRDQNDLHRYLPQFIDDFNNRPHVSLHGLTPNEAEQGITLDNAKLRDFIQQATMNRKYNNRQNRCSHC